MMVVINEVEEGLTEKINDESTITESSCGAMKEGTSIRISELVSHGSSKATRV